MSSVQKYPLLLADVSDGGLELPYTRVQIIQGEFLI